MEKSLDLPTRSRFGEGRAQTFNRGTQGFQGHQRINFLVTATMHSNILNVRILRLWPECALQAPAWRRGSGVQYEGNFLSGKHRPAGGELQTRLFLPSTPRLRHNLSRGEEGRVKGVLHSGTTGRFDRLGSKRTRPRQGVILAHAGGGFFRSRRNILPEGLRGIVSVNTTLVNRLYLASPCAA